MPCVSASPVAASLRRGVSASSVAAKELALLAGCGGSEVEWACVEALVPVRSKTRRGELGLVAAVYDRRKQCKLLRESDG